MTQSDLVLQKLSGYKILTVAEQGRKQEDQKKGKAIIQTRGDYDLEHGRKVAEVVKRGQMLDVF